MEFCSQSPELRFDLSFGREGSNAEDFVEVSCKVDVVQALGKSVNQIKAQDKDTDSAMMIGIEW